MNPKTRWKLVKMGNEECYRFGEGKRDPKIIAPFFGFPQELFLYKNYEVINDLIGYFLGLIELAAKQRFWREKYV